MIHQMSHNLCDNTMTVQSHSPTIQTEAGVESEPEKGTELRAELGTESRMELESGAGTESGVELESGTELESGVWTVRVRGGGVVRGGARVGERKSRRLNCAHGRNNRKPYTA